MDTYHQLNWNVSEPLEFSLAMIMNEAKCPRNAISHIEDGKNFAGNGQSDWISMIG